MMAQAAEWSEEGGGCMATSITEEYPFPLVRAEQTTATLQVLLGLSRAEQSTATLQVLLGLSRAEHCHVTSATWS